VGPLLKVFWPAALLLAVQSGWFLAGVPAEWGVERYTQYAAPVALLLTLAAFTRRELLTWRVLAVTLAGALPLLLAAGLRVTGEERAVFATSDVLGLSVPAALTLTAAALGLLALAVSRSLRIQAEPARGALVIGGVLLAVLVVQSQATWRWQLDVTRTWRTELPSDLSWVDHHSGGDVGLLLLTSANPRFADLDFFNKSVTQVYVPPAPITAKGLRGERCGWGVGEGGALQVGPECGELPHRFLLQDPGARIAFHGEREIARDPKFGRIVAVPDNPRVRSVLELPCNDPVLTFEGRRFVPVAASAPRPCRGVLTGAFWLDFPATAVLRFRGGTVAHTAVAGKKTYKLPAGQDTTIRLPVKAGAATVQLRLDWRSSAGAPELVDAELEGTAGSTPLL
jgi:hypothetical protein